MFICFIAAVALGLACSVQIVDEGAIAVDPNDVPVDALVRPVGFYQ